MQPMTIRPTKDGRKKIYIKPPQAYLKNGPNSPLQNSGLLPENCSVPQRSVKHSACLSPSPVAPPRKEKYEYGRPFVSPFAIHTYFANGLPILRRFKSLKKQ
jgi:hypothetical protein